jgi:hypothetical protein
LTGWLRSSTNLFPSANWWKGILLSNRWVGRIVGGSAGDGCSV